HPDLCEKLIPKWERGCRRITPGQGYLESFLLPNVQLTQSQIVRISETGLHTADGKFYEGAVGECGDPLYLPTHIYQAFTSRLCDRFRRFLPAPISCHRTRWRKIGGKVG